MDITSYQEFNSLCSFVLDYQRTNAYNRFLKKHAKGKVICDLGTGTGILSYLAKVHGAKKVYTYEINRRTYLMSKEVLEGCGIEQYFDDMGNVIFPTDIDFFIHEILYNLIMKPDTIDIINNIKQQYNNFKIYPHQYSIYEHKPSKKRLYVYDRNLYDPEVLSFIDKLIAHGLHIEDATFSLNSRYEIELNKIASFSFHDDLVEVKKKLPHSFLWKTYLDDYEFGNYPRMANNWGIDDSKIL